MKRRSETQERVDLVRQQMTRTWLMWGLAPIVVAAVLVLATGAVWASPAQVDEHTLERSFHAVLAICAALFLTGFWLDGHWTNSERIARRIWQAAGGEEFVPTRSQLAAQADLAFNTIRISAQMLTATGGAIAVAAVISVWAGLGMGEGIQLVILGVAYQIFILSRHPYYSEVLSAAVEGELVVAEDHDDSNH